ncbi:MAG TPA: hypothetical protein DCG69_00080 [Bacteroidales bacterium]|nr:hypothetical protein [Bacteroidales bacterium]
METKFTYQRIWHNSWILHQKKSNVMIKRTFFLMVVVVIFSSCATHKYSQINHAKFYQTDYPGNVFKSTVFNTSDSISELFVQVNLNALSVLSGQSKAEILNSYVFDYSLLDGAKEKVVLQSGQVKISDSPDANESFASFKIKLKTLQGNQFVLFSSIESLAQQKAYTTRTNILKGVSYSEQNFMLLNEDGSIHWDNFVRDEEKIVVKVNDASIKELFISWYAPKFSPAVVPFTPVRPDEIKNLKGNEPFKVVLLDGKTPPLSFKDLGIYSFHLDANQNQGISVYKFFKEYPFVATDAQRLFTLRYLNPRFEFEELMAMEPSEAVHQFWYSKSRKQERSEDMIRTYYNRVQRANELFTSYKEGWKTDRGMIFMIYGPPEKVFKFKDREVWEYGRDAFYSGLRFQFNKIENPYSQNDFRLLREAFYEPSWQGIVNNWRTDI